MLAGDTVGFRVGAYDRHAPLVIDPVLAYATYYGGAGADNINGVAVDGQGNVYVAGTTTSGFSAQTAFVSKFDPTGRARPVDSSTSTIRSSPGPRRLACDSMGTGIAAGRPGQRLHDGHVRRQGQR